MSTFENKLKFIFSLEIKKREKEKEVLKKTEEKSLKTSNVK